MEIKQANEIPDIFIPLTQEEVAAIFGFITALRRLVDEVPNQENSIRDPKGSELNILG